MGRIIMKIQDSWVMIIVYALICVFSILNIIQVFGLNIFNFPNSETSRLISWSLLVILLAVDSGLWHYRFKQLQKPLAVLRIKDFGNEKKVVYTGAWEHLTSTTSSNVVSETKTQFDTLFIDIFNIVKRGSAKKVWSNIEWINDDGKVVMSHKGRWYIPEPDKTLKQEENQLVDLDSNGYSRRLHFACINGQNPRLFFGLCREIDGKEWWENPKYKLENDHYKVRITLCGENDIKQEFNYKIRNNEGKIYIEEPLTPESKKIEAI